MKILTSDVNPRAGLTLSAGARTLTIGGAGVGVIAFGIASIGGWESFLRAYLVSFAWALSLSLGALFFVLLQHLTGSTWSVVVRRFAEATASNVLLLAILFIPIVAGVNVLYEWAHAAPGDHMIQHRADWFAKAFFVVRAAVYFGVWVLIARSFHRTSVAQDSSGDANLTVKMARRAPFSMVLYAITVTFASFDLFMSLDPHWYSTMYGVYYFAGAVVGFFALLTLAAYVLQRAGKLRDEITLEHYHDLGKQLFGWIIFWAYIAFSQYMLQWYGNMPEETAWYDIRQQGGWFTVSWILIIGHFLVPFLLLMPRGVKRKPLLLAGMAVFVLVMHWIDLFWLLAPEKGIAAGHVPFSLQDVACFVGHLALFVAGVTYSLGSGALLPEKDPRLDRSLAFENI